MSTPEPTTDLQRLIGLFSAPLAALGDAPSGSQLEQWSILVHASMSGGERDYHGIQHAFDVSEGAGSVETLAGLFHDTVYVQPDGYLSKQHETLFTDVIEKRGNRFGLRPYDPTQDRHRAMVEAVFGMKSNGVPAPLEGLSEFLSALLAVRCLKDSLSDELLMQVAAAIELTIPFRAADPSGRTPAEGLFRRLSEIGKQFTLQVTSVDLERAVHQAVAVANRDVAGFAFPDTGKFLDYTWQLLPESVMALRRKKTYTLGEYRTGLRKMAIFFSDVAPETVFCQFRGVPNDEEIGDLTGRAATNIERARRYLEAKLAASTVLYAIALRTGGDAPAALFMGDLPSSGRRSMRLEDFLPAPGPLSENGDAAVYALLAEGRQNESAFDIRNSPLAAYLYARLGQYGIKRLAECAVDPTDGGSAARTLSLLPADVLNNLSAACARMVITRTPELTALTEGVAGSN
ncbi:MAG: hypothetical protein WBN68_11090 [Sedimenticolaceae bacterium]